MTKGNIGTAQPSRATYEVLEEMVRAKVQEYIQEVLEDEVEIFLGRKKSEPFKKIVPAAFEVEESRESPGPKAVDHQECVFAILFGDVECVTMHVLARNRQMREATENLATQAREL